MDIKPLVTQLLVALGEDPYREGLLNTPKRFEKAMRDLTFGHKMTVQEAVGEGIFPGEGEGLIIVKDIEFFSLCEHHLLPFWGTASIGYYPSGKILGLSKLARITEVFSRRLQVQERLTRQISEAIFDLASPRAVFTKVTGQHMCMMMRGVKKINSHTITEHGQGLETLSETEKTRLFSNLTI